jgi:hypothetical protein
MTTHRAISRPNASFGRLVARRLSPLLVLATAVLAGACDSHILDIAPQDRIAESAVWNDEKLIDAYQTELYNAIPHGFYIHMYSKYTDEAFNNAPCCGADIFKRNTFNADNISSVSGGDFWGGYMYYWNQGYTYVRKINVFLQKMSDRTDKITNQDQMVAEARFLRAFIYFELLERFGGVPIMNDAYTLDQVSSTTLTRASVDEVVTAIKADLDAAMPDLPDQYASTDANFGRATKDAAMALWSRVSLYAASPLFNPSNDMSKWQTAANAAEAVLNEHHYTLYPDYGKLFMLKSGDAENEYIYARMFTVTNGQQAPMNNLPRRFGAYGGWWASNGPSQNLVDDYDMANGEPAFTYSGQGANITETVNPASGYDPQQPYANRDPRFEATIIHDGSVYHPSPDLPPTFEMWESADGNSWGYDSYKQSGDNPRGDYVLRKFMPGPDEPLSWQQTYTQPWPFFRLAEMYLNAAEAEFALGHEGQARDYLTPVRARAGLPPIPASVTGEALRQRIYNERRIELAFEGHRFFDIRRWKIAGDIEDRPIRGMKIIKDTNTGVETFTPVVLLTKAPWEEKMYLLPIDVSEIQRTGLPQNPGY